MKKFGEVCSHGNLKRKCEICERDDQIADLNRHIAEMTEKFRDAEALVIKWQDQAQIEMDKQLELFNKIAELEKIVKEKDAEITSWQDKELNWINGGNISFNKIHSLEASLKVTVDALEGIKIRAHGIPPYDIYSGDQEIFETVAEALDQIRKANPGDTKKE